MILHGGFVFSDTVFELKVKRLQLIMFLNYERV